MSNSILRGAALAHCVIQSNEAGTFLRMNARADYTETIREEMGWDELGLRTRMADLDGEVAAGRLALTSQQQTLDGGCPELRLGFESMGKFRAVRCKAKDAQSSHVELRWHIISRDPNAAALAMTYKSEVKDGLGELRISVGEDPIEEPEGDGNQMTIHEGMKLAKGTGGKPKKLTRHEQLAAAASANAAPLTAREKARLERMEERA